MLAKWKGLSVAIFVLSDESVAKKEKPAALWNSKNEVTHTTVQFGQVTGVKYVEFMELWSGPGKRVIYVLSVPGGQVEVHVICAGKKPSPKWDETPIESFFSSLRIVAKPP